MLLKSGSRSRRAEQARMEAAAAALDTLRSSLAEAYRTFNRTTDPALLEASILEISALQVRYDCLLRSIKEMNGEFQNAACDHHHSGRRGRTVHPAAQASEKADQMGV